MEPKTCGDNYSQVILSKIQAISSDKKQTLIDSVVDLCQENDYDVGEFVSSLDEQIKEMFRAEALENGMVRRSKIPSKFKTGVLTFD